jgi:hypothetical protein
VVNTFIEPGTIPEWDDLNYNVTIVADPTGGGMPVDPDWGVEAPSAPIALPMPDMSIPDFGGMDLDW